MTPEDERISNEAKDGLRAGLDWRSANITAEPTAPPKAIRTGIGALDWSLRGGLREGGVTLVAAGTGHGKTALVEQIALEASTQVPTHMFTLEMGKTKTEARMLTKLMGQDLATIERMRYADPKNPQLNAALEALVYDRRLFLEERDLEESYTSSDLFSSIVAVGAKLVIIDHPRHLDDWAGIEPYYRRVPASTPGGKSRREIVRPDAVQPAIAKRILAAARYCACHIIVIQQFSKDHIVGRKPGIADVADSYVLPQICENAVLINRPFRGQSAQKDVGPDGRPAPSDRVAELILEKNRYGPEGTVHSGWIGRTMTFTDLLPDEEKEIVAQCCPPKTPRRVKHAS